MEPPVFKQREGALLHSGITDEGIEKIKIAFGPTGKIQTKIKEELRKPKEPVKKLKDLKTEDPAAKANDGDSDKNDLQKQISKLRTALQQLKKSLVNLTDQITQVKLTIGKTDPAPKLTPKEKTPTPIPAIIGTKEDLDTYTQAIKNAAKEIKAIRPKPIETVWALVLIYTIENQLCPAAKKLGKTSANIKEDLETFKFDDNTSFTVHEINRILTEFERIIQKN